jgi:predicted CXXCH cytochrome family protein
MPKHVVRLLLLMAAGLVFALVAKWFLTPDSFARFGHYRANAVTEIASLEPVHMTPGYCERCHDDRHAEWSAGNHRSVSCENCHGPGKGHPKGGVKKLPIPTDTARLCTQCHEATAGRPATQPQIVVADHKNGEKCVPCHNPHSPKNAANVALSGKVENGKALAARACAECHGAAGISTNGTWPSLAGLNAAYLVRITTAYKTGDQKDVAMTPLAKKLSDADIQDLAAYYASLPCGDAKTGAFQGDVAEGQLLAQHCARCHGDTGVSPIASWPLLAGQAPGYLVNVLKAYRAGLRKDPLMARAAGSLSDADITNLAAFYSGQKCQADK